MRSTFSTGMFICCTLGMVVSTTALILLLLTAVLFEEWRKVYKNQLLLQFMVARFFFTIVRYETELHRFLSGSDTDLQRNYAEVILMTYTEIALVGWMFLFTKQMYDNFVRVLFVEIALWKISLAAWVIPVAITAVLFFSCVYKKLVNTIFFKIYLLIAKWPVLLVNGVLLIIILKTILTDNKSRKIKNRRIVVVMVVLILSFSIQQIIWDGYKLGRNLNRLHNHNSSMNREENIEFLIMNGDGNYDYSPLFFKITNTFTVYQCAASIFFWLFGNERTRVMWGLQKDKMIRKQSTLTSVVTVNTTKL